MRTEHNPRSEREWPGSASPEAYRVAHAVEQFVRNTVVPLERDARCTAHGPSDPLVQELRNLAKRAGVLTPHIRQDGSHFSFRDTAPIFRMAGLSPLGPVAVNAAAPDEGNMVLIGKVGTPDQQARYLAPLIAGKSRSAFFMTEPALEGGAGSDPAMMLTTAVADGDHWIITGRKAFITGAVGATIGIVMAKTRQTAESAQATMFLVDLPHPGLTIERVLDTIDQSSAGGHSVITIDQMRVPESSVLGELHKGFEFAQVRLAPARLSHCMRWHGAATRAHEIATDYACRRLAFGKLLVDHEGVGFMLADNLIDLKQSELMIDWCAGVLDSGARGTHESSLTKVAVSEQLYRVADRCVQIMGGSGVSRDQVVEQVFREIRAFRIYDGPSEVHRWSIAKHIIRSRRQSLPS